MKPLQIALPWLLSFFLSSGTVMAAPMAIQPEDKCPVCGMFVAKYTDFLAQIRFADGTYNVFDGAKDMFKFYFDMGRYRPGGDDSAVSEMYVTDYYSLTLIDAKKAFYVIGSDIYGPMGNELIPFVSRIDAEEFKRDHAGTAILAFADITMEIVGKLDR